MKLVTKCDRPANPHIYRQRLHQSPTFPPKLPPFLALPARIPATRDGNLPEVKVNLNYGLICASSIHLASLGAKEVLPSVIETSRPCIFIE